MNRLGMAALLAIGLWPARAALGAPATATAGFDRAHGAFEMPPPNPYVRYPLQFKRPSAAVPGKPSALLARPIGQRKTISLATADRGTAFTPEPASFGRTDLGAATYVRVVDDGLATHNDVELVEVRLPDGRLVRAVFKPRSGEHVHESNPNQAGTYYTREIAFSALDDEYGFDVVPPTVQFTIGRRIGSLQGFVDGVPLAQIGKTAAKNLDRDRIERIRVLDFIGANADRHEHNARVENKTRPWAYDHGSAMPSSPGRYLLHDDRLYQPGPLQPATLELIGKLESGRIAELLNDAGVDHPSIERVLERVEYLKTNPNVLRVGRATSVVELHQYVDASGYWYPYPMASEGPVGKVLSQFRIGEALANAGEAISPEKRARIDGIMAALPKGKAARALKNPRHSAAGH